MWLATLSSTGTQSGIAAGSALTSLVGTAISVGVPIGVAVLGIRWGFGLLRRGLEDRAGRREWGDGWDEVRDLDKAGRRRAREFRTWFADENGTDADWGRSFAGAEVMRSHRQRRKRLEEEYGELGVEHVGKAPKGRVWDWMDGSGGHEAKRGERRPRNDEGFEEIRGEE